MQQFQEGQTRTRRSTGEVQEFRNGAWVTVKEGSGPQPMMSVQTRGADPLLPGRLQGQQLNNRQTQAQTDRVIQMTPAELQKATADAAKAEAERQKAVIEAQTAETSAENKKKGDEASRAQLTQLISNLDELQKDAADGGGWFETGATGALLRNRPGTAAYDLMSRVKGIQGSQFIEALRQLKSQSQSGSTGAGGLTEQEGERILSATGNLDPNQSQQQFLDMIAQAREAALGGYRRVGGNDPQVDPSLDKGAALPGVGNKTSGMALANGNTKAEVDPILQAVGTRVGQMLSQGVPDGKVMQFLRDNGVDPSVTNINSALQARKTPQFKAWQRANPGSAYPIGPEFYTKQVPLSTPQALMNSAAQSGLGAYAASAAQAVTGNHLDDIGGESVNTGLEMLRRDHPTATLLGDISGQAMFDAVGSKVLPLAKMGKFAHLGQDALYGGVSGQGEGDTLGGLVSNVAGGAVGRGLHGATTAALRGVRPSSSLAYLNEADIPLTVGQIGRGSGTTLGNAIGGLEDRAAGVPIFDAIINSARKRGEEGFNKAAFKEAGGSGVTGSAGVNELGQKVGDAYSFLDNAQIPLDAQFAGSQAGVKAALPDLPEFGTQIGKSLGTINKSATVGDGAANLSGRDWQSAIRATRANRSSLAGAPFSDGASGLLGDVEDNLLTLAERQGPAGTVDALKSANKLNGQYQTILSALDNGPAQARGEMFSPLRLDNASRAGARNYGGRAASMRGERPFYGLSQAGMDVMPNQVPDSGTAGRALMYSALFGAGLGGGLGAGGNAAAGGDAGDGAVSGGMGGAVALPVALAALYSKPGQKAIQSTLLGKRGVAAQTLGDYIAGDGATTNNVLKAVQKAFGRKAFGNYGAGTLRDLLLLNELPEQN